MRTVEAKAARDRGTRQSASTHGAPRGASSTGRTAPAHAAKVSFGGSMPTGATAWLPTKGWSLQWQWPSPSWTGACDERCSAPERGAPVCGCPWGRAPRWLCAAVGIGAEPRPRAPWQLGPQAACSATAREPVVREAVCPWQPSVGIQTREWPASAWAQIRRGAVPSRMATSRAMELVNLPTCTL